MAAAAADAADSAACVASVAAGERGEADAVAGVRTSASAGPWRSVRRSMRRLATRRYVPGDTATSAAAASKR